MQVRNVLLLFGAAILIGGAATHQGVFYETGAQYYTTCSKLKDHAERLSFGDEPPAGSIQCSMIFANTLEGLKFGLGNAAGDNDSQALARDCLDVQQMPIDRRLTYFVALDAIEGAGGPNTSDSFTPASWLIERAAHAAWPHCAETMRRISAKTQKTEQAPPRS
jgi:hypothetical protein